MEILIGLGIATVLVIGWFFGNMFACVFLTLGTLGAVTFCFLFGQQVAAGAILAGIVALCVVWAPRTIRLHDEP